MGFFTKLKKYAKVRTHAGFLLVGILFIVISTVIIFAPKGERLTAEATIQDIVSYQDFDEVQQKTIISFTDAEGKYHEGLEFVYNTGMKIGDTVEIEYLVDDPECISSVGGDYIPYIILAVGAICAVVSLILLIKAIKTPSDDMNDFDKVDKSEIDESKLEEIRNNDEPLVEYYFHYTGKLNQSYIMETHGRQPIYEAVCDKVGVVKPYEVTFVNHLTGSSVSRKVTHTLTQSTGVGNNISITDSSSFKIDGVDNWDYLGKLGYSLEPHIEGLKINCDLLHYGIKVARIESAGANILKDGATNPLGDKLPGKGLYKVSCKTSDVEGAFMACFSLARVDFF